MKKIFLSVIAAFTLSACEEQSQTVVIAGDSWGFFVCTFKSLDKALKNAGVLKAGTNSTCSATTRIGMRAEAWSGSTFDKATQIALQDKKVKVLYLSLGGNDLMNNWNKGMSTAQEQAVFQKIIQNLQNIIQSYQKIRPDIKILISGYDFPRFTPNHPIADYKEAYEAMGSPNPGVLNRTLVRFSSDVAKLADQKSVFYIQHFGLMHYYFGNEEASLPSRRTLPPEQISAPNDPNHVGGDVTLLTDPKAMLTVNQTIDAFHLSQEGYDRLSDHTVFHYLKNWLSQ